MRQLVMVLGLVLSAVTWSAPHMPAVYRDDYVTINAGVVDVSRGLLRAGSIMTLEVSVHFDPETTRVGELDNAFFERTFAEHAAFRLLGSDGDSDIRQSGDEAVLTHRWHFQVMACPDGSGHCPGEREYELPIVLVDYDLMSQPGGRPSQRSARLRPWPGSITLVSAFPQQLPEDAALDDWVPAGAMPMPVEAKPSGYLALLPLTVGASLLLFAFLRSGRQERVSLLRPAEPVARWQAVAASLANDTLSDAEWLDRYRRSLVWFLTDAHGINPYSRTAAQTAADAQRLLRDISVLSSVDDRQPWLDHLDLALGAKRDKDGSQ